MGTLKHPIFFKDLDRTDGVMKDKPLIVGLGFLVIAAVALAMINTDALYVDAGVFLFIGCVAYIGRGNRR